MQLGWNPIPLTAFRAGMQSYPLTTVTVVGGVTYGGYKASSYLFNGR